MSSIQQSTRSRLVLAGVALGAAALPALGDQPCAMPDIGGTVPSWPDACPYVIPPGGALMEIIDGLPAGASIEIDAVLRDFIISVIGPGGSLGGGQQQFDAALIMPMTGAGALAGFNRTIGMSVTGETHSGPRTPGDPVQSFPTDFFLLQGQIFGDPDFDSLQIRVGTGFGLPSPGQTTLTRLGPPGSQFNVDSFFDIVYEIDFVGAPGSVLDGFSGTTVGTVRWQQGCPPGPVDPFETCPRAGEVTSTFVRFGTPEVPPLPADFFEPGSDPFDGQIAFVGANPAGPDTRVLRAADPFLPLDPPGGPVPIPVEIVELKLVSASPITVVTAGNPVEWDVELDLSPTAPQTPGQLGVIKTHANGGTFDGILPVLPRFVFTRPGETRILDFGDFLVPPIDLEFAGVPWVHAPDPSLGIEAAPGQNFFPGVEETTPGDPNSQVIVPFSGVSPAGSVQHTVCPPQGLSAIPTLSEWGLIVLALLLLAAGTIVIRREMALRAA